MPYHLSFHVDTTLTGNQSLRHVIGCSIPRHHNIFADLSRRSKEATKTLRVKGHKRVEKRSAGRRELAIGSSLQEVSEA
jgi:hypothetical protein